MASNAYYVTAIYTCAQVQMNPGQSGRGEKIQVWDASLPVIVFSHSPDEAQNLFESELLRQPEGEAPKEITIRKFYAAPIVDQLLTEWGNMPLDWPSILERSVALVQSTPVDDFEQGYWVDVDKTVGPDKLSFSLGTLQSDMPEEVRVGLNWSDDKQFFFVLLVLPLPAPPTIPTYEEEVEDGESESFEELGPGKLDEMNVVLPETVAIIQARNSVAAAWLWRKYAANLRWNILAIRITPLCGTIGEPT
jgi:hypothetical protein